MLPISDEELAQPAPRPHDFQFKFYVQGHEVPLGKPPSAPDLIGVPVLTPAYTFGLTFEPAPDGNGAHPSVSSTLPLIAVVSSSMRDYAVALLGTPDLDGVATYHLKLAPLRKPKDNRLRELWIGVKDYLPRKAVVAGNFTIAPLVDVPWTVTFALLRDAPVIADERADATLYLPHRRVVRDAEIAFENVHEPGNSIVGEPLVEPNVSGDALVEPSMP